MASFQRQVIINAPPADVFGAITDLDNCQAFMPDVVKVKMMTPGPLRKGSKWKETRQFKLFKFIPLRGSAVIEVSDFEQGHKYTTVADDGCNWASYTLTTEAAPDGTQVTLDGEFKMLGKYANKPEKAERLKNWCERADGDMLDRLKAYLEG